LIPDLDGVILSLEWKEAVFAWSLRRGIGSGNLPGTGRKKDCTNFARIHTNVLIMFREGPQIRRAGEKSAGQENRLVY